jgi:hypothetical protein
MVKGIAPGKATITATITVLGNVKIQVKCVVTVI